MSYTTPIDITQVVTYGGHSLSATGSVNLTFKAMYSDLDKTIMLHQLLNNDITVKAKLPGRKKPIMLGIFRIKHLDTAGDGCSAIKLNGLNTFVEMDNLNLLPTKQDGDEELFTVRYEAEVEIEEDEKIGET